MTKRNVSNRRFSIKSFLNQFQKRKHYLAALERDYRQQAIELETLKRVLHAGLIKQGY